MCIVISLYSIFYILLGKLLYKNVIRKFKEEEPFINKQILFMNGILLSNILLLYI